LPNLRQTTHE